MRVALVDGAYTARSLIANAQRCLNLYPEANAQPDAPAPMTHYPTPGLSLLQTAPGAIGYRGLYRASNGDLYGVVGTQVFYISPRWVFTRLGSIAPAATPVSMADNGLTLVLVDGSAAGYTVDLTSRAFTPISDPSFYGADRVDYLDTFFLFNRPGTAQFYISLSESASFDPLDIAAKTGYPDPLAAVIVMHREVWLIGTLKSEIWYDAGAADFAFQAMPGAFVEHGCIAKYSIAAQDLSVYWLSQDLQGNAIVMQGSGYQATRISTHAIEHEFATYVRVSDAIAYVYQQDGHAFYVLNFPSADKTWVFDAATGLWHQRAWLDGNGMEHRQRAICCANAYGKIVVGDWENGKLYALALDSYTDDGAPIKRLRAFPHLLNDGKRVFYRRFVADMAVGTDDGMRDGTSAAAPPMISLRWSDTRGASWGNAIEQSLGDAGRYLTNIQFQRLGMARDRVFELSWSVPAPTALNGAFIELQSAAT